MLQQTMKISIAIILLAVIGSFFVAPMLEKQSETAPQAIVAKGQKPVIAIATQAPYLPQSSPNSNVRGIEYLQSDARGHFSASIEVNGINIQTLVDTGASMVAFGASDAERAGIRPSQSDYKYKSQTANGEVAMARVIVPRMRLGSIELENIEAAVLPDGALNGTLLGMSFLRRLQVQTENGIMVLKQ
jgi:aspartyl protease family protein